MLVEQSRSLLCTATAGRVDPAVRYMTISTVLHEAAHNLGPSHEYRVDDRTDGQVFGGPLASTLEELKAQDRGAVFLRLARRPRDHEQGDADKTHVRDVLWSFGHIAQGMNDARGSRSHTRNSRRCRWVSSTSRVLRWNAEEKAANGRDVGCFEVDLGKWPAAVETLRGSRSASSRAAIVRLAEKTRDEWVTDGTPWAALRGTIQERWLRARRASFVYSVTSP